MQKSEELSEQNTSKDWQYRLRLTQARQKEAQGDLDGALDLLDRAERLYVRSPMPDLHPVAAFKTRVWIGRGANWLKPWVGQVSVAFHLMMT